MKNYFIDTNIIIYAHGAEHKYKAPCQLIMRLIAADEIGAVTNVEVLQELLHRYARPGKSHYGAQMAENVLAIFHEILPVEKNDILLAMNLLKKYDALNIRDAIHAATALRGNVKYILSVDKHFDRLPSLQRVDPLEIL